MPSQGLFSRVPVGRFVPLAALLLLGACAQVEVRQSVKAPELAFAPEPVAVEPVVQPPTFAPYITILPPRPAVYVEPPRPVVVVPPRPVIVVEPPCPPPVVIVRPPHVVVLPSPEIDVPGDRTPGQWFPVTN